MPGIHVRSVSKLDWVERGNEPVLTVPGAYWLCHKKQIYKFTFKWNKTRRDTDEFAYPKELTKVIRRIIKSQPRQGQQFGTRHLLVTYNHSSWLRQDKMFAMLKFRDRTDATAFPHAFVLTVKTIKETSVDEATSKYQQDISCDSNKRIEKSDEDDEKNRRLQETRKDKEIREETRDSSGNFAKPHDFRKPGRKRKLTNRDKIPEAPVSCSTGAEIEWRKDPGKRTASRAFNFDDTDSIPAAKRRKQRQLRSAYKCADKVPADYQSEEGTAGDTADLPYQYLIEKEIEDSKCTRENVETDYSAQQLQQKTEFNTGSTKLNKDVDLLGKIVSKSPKNCQQNDNSTRSADITDLVMEGLMFTIRQDQDSVTVVEQRTKLEMDEVLENSEKAETKEGEKCLLNSSLLRLESLITKIEMSGSESKTKNRLRIDGNENLIKNVEDDKDISLRFDNEPPVAETPKLPLVKIDLSNIRGVLDSKLQFNVDAVDSGGEETEKVDFCGVQNSERGEKRSEICEMERNEKNDEKADEKQDGDKKEEEAKEKENEEEEEEGEEEVGLTLKYEESETEIPVDEVKYEEKTFSLSSKEAKSSKSQEINKILEESPKNHSSDVKEIIENDSETLETPIKDSLVTPKSRTPRVVSNERVTYEQMPPALRRALQHKLTTKTGIGAECENNSRKESAEEMENEIFEESEEEFERKTVKNDSQENTEDISKKNEVISQRDQLPEEKKSLAPKKDVFLQNKEILSVNKNLSLQNENSDLEKKDLSRNEKPEPKKKDFPLRNEKREPEKKDLSSRNEKKDLSLRNEKRESEKKDFPSRNEKPDQEKEDFPLPEESLTSQEVLPQPEIESKSEKAGSSTEELTKNEIPATIDVTEDFERELSSRKTSEQRFKRKSLRNSNQSCLNPGNPQNDSEIRIDMWKFMQDMTRGARVVIHRLDLTNIQNGIGSTNNGLSLTKYATRRCTAESK